MPDDILSLDAAVSLLSTAPEAPAASDAPDAEETKTAAPETPAVETKTEITPKAKNADGTEIASDEASTEDDQADRGDALPTIEPPSSWKAEEKAGWEALPRNVQEALVRREQDSTKELRNLQNSTAEQRKAADAEVARLKGLTGSVEKYVANAANELAKQFPDIKSEADVVALSKTDPARFVQLQAGLMQIASAQAAQVEAAKELSAREATAQHESNLKAKDALLEAFPQWKDAEVARKEVTELQDYAIKLGVPEQAARANIDPWTFKIAQKAMLYDRAQAAKAAAVEKVPPRVLKPGTSNTVPKNDTKAAVRRSQLEKLTSSGDLEDAIGLLRA